MVAARAARVRRPRQRAPSVANGVQQGGDVGQLAPGLPGALGQEQRQGEHDGRQRHPEGEEGRSERRAPGQRDLAQGAPLGRSAERARGSRGGTAGRPTVEAGVPASRTTAPGTTTTRWPASWARQPKSRSAPCSTKRRSKPPMSSQTERRTSMPLVLTASTSARPSYWPWSASPTAGRGEPAARAGDLDAHLDEPAGVVPADDLGPGDADRLRPETGREQLGQASRGVAAAPRAAPRPSASAGSPSTGQRLDAALDGAADRDAPRRCARPRGTGRRGARPGGPARWPPTCRCSRRRR